MLKKIFTIFCSLFFIVNIAQANSQQISIVAVVGNEVITNYDVEQRLKIIALTSGRNFAAAELRQLQNQILELLITEKIQNIEAKKYDIVASEADLEKSYQNLATERQMNLEKFEQALSANQIPLEIFKDQLQSSLNWQNLVIYRIRPQIRVTDVELEDYISLIKANNDQAEYQIETITLPIAKPEAKAEVQKLAEQLYNKISSGEAKFSDIANEFNIGAAQEKQNWKLLADLPEELRNIVNNLQPAEFTQPVATEQAVLLVKLHAKRALNNDIDDEKIKDELYKKLFLQKIEAKAESYLKNLRRSTYIERKSF